MWLNILEQSTIYDWAGYLGVAFYVLSYTLLQVGVIRGSGYWYAIMNLGAASLVLLSLMQNFNLSSAIIQIMWIGISSFGIIRLYTIHKSIRFNDEERALLADALPDMPPQLARQLLNRGVWSNAVEGTELTREGESVTHLHFLADGEADVFTAGHRIATIRRGFVGEMNVMESGPASAGVTISRPGRLFTISGEVLQKMARSDSEFRAYLEMHLSQATRTKLVEANKKIFQTDNGYDVGAAQ